MTPETTRSSLLIRVQDSSNHDAWREFERRYRDLVFRYCASRRLQASDAEDICQLVMADMLSTLPRFHYDRRKGRFRHYLGRVVKRRIGRYLRERTRAEAGEMGGRGAAATDRDMDDPLWEREWVHFHLRLAMKELREDFHPRSVRAFDALLDGDSIAAVASMVGLSEPAVHKVKQRVLRRLKERVAQQVAREESFGDRD